MPRSRPAGRRPASRASGHGLLLRRTPFGETSLVVHVLTPDHGRVELMAKGAHRPRSRFFGVLDWFDTLDLSWVQRSDSDLGTLREGELLTRRRQLTRSLRSYRAAQTVIELTDLVTRAGFSDRGQFVLAEEALDALDQAQGPPSALLAGFELKLLEQLGLAPALVTCATCGATAAAVDATSREPRAPFSTAVGGRLCPIHANETHASGLRVGTLPVAILESAQLALSAPLGDLDRANWPAEHSIRVLDFAGRFLDHHLEARPKSHARFLAAPDRNRRTAPSPDTP
ncbi:DNA repair protein RecO [Planctomycetota bacterium]|jgi:DNA repair protein RecO|nr:DNA repair protein RecO [Planctomycetota bacterium]